MGWVHGSILRHFTKRQPPGQQFSAKIRINKPCQSKFDPELDSELAVKSALPAETAAHS